MHGIGIGGGMHGHGRDAELLAGAQDAKCDLAAIGDQDFLEHVFFSSVVILRSAPLRASKDGHMRLVSHPSRRALTSEHLRMTESSVTQ